MCLFNVHKIIFQEGGWFFMSFCISKIYHLWQKDWDSGLITSIADIISTRGCIEREWNERESEYLFISGLSIHRNPGKRNCIFGERPEGWLAHLPLPGLFAGDEPEPPTQQPLWARVLWKPASMLKLCGENHQINPLVCKVDAGQGNSDGL